MLKQRGGKDISYSPASGIHILYDKGYAFKDLNRNGKIDIYEDWRKSSDERASGLLPVQFPANMRTVEEQYEDTPRDMECYKDADGNVYDFAFGMNWSGVINDERVQKYR